MNTIEEAMKRLSEMAKTQTPPPKPPSSPWRGHFLTAQRTEIGPEITLSTNTPFKNPDGRLSEKFKKACANEIARRLPGIKEKTLQTARSLHFISVGPNGSENIAIEMPRLIRWMDRYIPEGHRGALQFKLKNAFGQTPPWAPGQTWEDLLPTQKSPPPKGPKPA